MRPSTRLALIAFVAHGPGLRLLTSYRFSPALLRINAAALALTVVATAGAAAMGGEHRVAAGVSAFVIGHFCWSACLASHVAREKSADEQGESSASERPEGQ